jgi:hypothetical protein
MAYLTVAKFPEGTEPMTLPGVVESMQFIRYRDPSGVTQELHGLKLEPDGKTITPNGEWPSAHADPFIRVFVND